MTIKNRITTAFTNMLKTKPFIKLMVYNIPLNKWRLYTLLHNTLTITAYYRVTSIDGKFHSFETTLGLIQDVESGVCIVFNEDGMLIQATEENYTLYKHLQDKQ